VTACANGYSFSELDRKRLTDNDILYREESIARLTEQEKTTVEIKFDIGPALRCDALFFGSDQGQRSPLAKILGCEIDTDGLVRTYDKQKTCVPGVFVAGDAAVDVQFAIVAAAEGASAAVAINHMLQEQESR
jgi:thioredoxin reductase